MEISIKDHLTDEELKAIAIRNAEKIFYHEFSCESDLKRIVTNASYDIVWKMIDDVFDGKLKEMLKVKVEEVINDLSSFSIFKKPDAWSKETNNAYDHFQNCIEANFIKIQTIVKEQIEPQTLERIRESIDDLIIDAIRDIYKTKGDK